MTQHPDPRAMRAALEEVRFPSRVRVEPHAVVFEDWGLQRLGVLASGMAAGALLARYVLVFGADRLDTSDAPLQIFAASMGLAVLSALLLTAFAGFVASRMKVAKVTFTAHGYEQDGQLTSYDALQSWGFEEDRLVLVATDGSSRRTPVLTSEEREALERLLVSRAEPATGDVPDALGRLRAQAARERQGLEGT